MRLTYKKSSLEAWQESAAEVGSAIMGVSQDELDLGNNEGDDWDAGGITGALVSIAGILALVLLLMVVGSLVAAVGWLQHPAAQ
jgi:hypothetical protein